MLLSQAVILVAVLVPSAQGEYPWSLKMHGEEAHLMPAEGARVVDIDGDGVEEFVAYDQEQSDIVFNQDLEPLYSFPVDAQKHWFLGAHDVNGDGRVDLLFFDWNPQDGAVIRMQISHGDSFCQSSFKPLGLGLAKSWHGGAGKAQFLDVDGNGGVDAVFPLAIAGDGPNGLVGVDLDQGSLLWIYHVESSPYEVRMDDLDLDGSMELVLLTEGLCYRPSSRDRSSEACSSEVHVLRKDKTLLYMRCIGGYRTVSMAGIADTDNDGKSEIVVAPRGAEDGTIKNSVYLIGAHPWATRDSVQIPGAFEGLSISDLDQDGRQDILIGSHEGNLIHYEYREGFKRKNIKPLKQSPLVLFDVLDLDGDGKDEVVLAGEESNLVILNHLLDTEPLLLEEMGHGFGFFPLRNGRSYRIVAFAGQENVTLAIYDIVKGRSWPRSPWTTATIAVSIGAVLCLSLLAWWTLTASARFTKDAPFPVVTMGHEGPLAAANKMAVAVLGDRDLKRLRFPSLELPYRLHSFSLLGRKYAILMDTRAAGATDRAVAWAGMAQRLAHDFKNPLSILVLATQRLKSQVEGSKGEKYVDTIMEELQRLRRWVDGFMRFLSLKGPQLVPTDVGSLLSKMKERFGKALPDDVNLELRVGEDIPLISADQALLEDALGNIIDNALSAVGSRGHVTVRASKEERIVPGKRDQAVEEVVIEIADDGPGISEEDQKKLFTPYFTRKPSGTGLGLVIAKRVVEDHQGIIRVESKPGIGTRVTISLPVSQKVENA